VVNLLGVGVGMEGGLLVVVVVEEETVVGDDEELEELDEEELEELEGLRMLLRPRGSLEESDDCPVGVA